MIEIIKRKKIESLILNIIIIFILVCSIVLNLDDYKQIFIEENLITNDETLNNAIHNNKRFVTLDSTDAQLTRFSIKNNETNEIEINTYKIKYEDQTLIIFLKENTAITDEIKGEIITPKYIKSEIQKQLKQEFRNENIIDMCFSNVDYMAEEKIIRTKFIGSIALIVFLIGLSIIDAYYFINPKKTRKYKKYIKKNKKAN